MRAQARHWGLADNLWVALVLLLSDAWVFATTFLSIGHILGSLDLAPHGVSPSLTPMSTAYFSTVRLSSLAVNFKTLAELLMFIPGL